MLAEGFRATLARVKRRLWLLFALAACGLLRASPASAHEPTHKDTPAANFDKFVPGATELEGKIIAPCCWTQTIDVHGSPASTELRLEIRRRLTAGETSEAIEQSFVQRYGEKVLAVPPGSKLGSAALWIGLSILAAGGGALALMRRWQQRGGLPALAGDAGRAQAAGSNAADAALDARVDAELAKLDPDK